MPALSGEATALGLTLLIEVPLYALLLRLVDDIALPRGIAVGAALNVCSHPVAFLAVVPAATGPLGPVASLAVAEVGVAWWGEALLLWWWLSALSPPAAALSPPAAVSPPGGLSPDARSSAGMGGGRLGRALAVSLVANGTSLAVGMLTWL